MKTWILVADSARARLFETGAVDGDLQEIGGYANPQARTRPSAEGPERKPRVHESANSARHAIEPHTDAADKSAQSFAHGLAEILDQGRIEHDYTRLLLVAPPRFLGQLNAALDHQVAKLVVQTVGKDVTRASPAEIRQMLDAHD
ncbi:MAG: host attachment protein [Lysobacterales bacterium]